MILTCPQCDTRFVVPSTIFMRGGRKLRCSSCKHKWFQEEPLEKAEGLNYAASLKSSSGDESSEDKELLLDKIKSDFTNGYKVIAGVFFIIIIGFFIYRALTPPLVMGQGLAFDNVAIERKEDQLIVTGEIVNAMDSDRGVPLIQITKILMNDIQGDTVIIAPEKEILHSGETMALSATIDNAGVEVKNLKVTFKSDATDQEKSKEENADASSDH